MIIPYTVIKIHKDFSDLYISPNISCMIKLMIMNWAGHIARTCYGKYTNILYILRKNDTFFTRNNTYTILFVTQVLHTILIFRYTSFRLLTKFTRTPCFALCIVFLQSFLSI